MDPIFSLRNLKKTYAGRRVLDIAELDILTGEVIALVGPSGAGKSTLLRLLNFLEPADSGRLDYAGRPAGPEMPLKTRREVITVFQRPALLNASVEENAAYGLRLRGLHGEQPALEELLRRLGLEALRRANARSLSGGEMQRVALARALVVHPRVLLLDEPTANLDPYNVGLIEEVVREANRTAKTTIVLVTHNIFQARRLAERCALLLNGQIVELGHTHSFFETPEDSRTRAFVNGEMIY
jgi:tungstate transport system ATP-binding protein